MKGLEISKGGPKIPCDAVTRKFGILGQSGKGKTYTAAVLAEEMLEKDLHVVIIDPIGRVWTGLRSSASGNEDGYPIPIFGGEHKDFPLSISNVHDIVSFIVQDGQSAILDLSDLGADEQIEFMAIFTEQIYRLNRKPLHIIFDEADMWAPQYPFGKGARRLLNATDCLVRRGRFRGIGTSLISQRPAAINKNVLSQIDVMVVLGLAAPQDLKAIRSWLENHTSKNKIATTISSLPSLPKGTAWLWSPEYLNRFSKIQVRERNTYDSSRTPEIGDVPKPIKFAPLSSEVKRLADKYLSFAKDNDPMGDSCTMPSTELPAIKLTGGVLKIAKAFARKRSHTYTTDELIKKFKGRYAPNTIKAYIYRLHKAGLIVYNG